MLPPDGKTILMAESKKNRVLAYDVKSPGKVGERKVFCELPSQRHGQRPNRQSAGRYVP